MTNSEIDTKTVKKFTKKTLYESFYDTLKFSNYKVLLCYKLAFHINSITVNKGSIIAIILFCFYLIFFILYCFEGIIKLKIAIAKWLFRRKKKLQEEKEENIIEDKEKLGKFGSSKMLVSDSKINSETQKSMKSSKFKVNLPPKKISGSNDVQITSKKFSDKTMFTEHDLNSPKNSNVQIIEIFSEKKLDNYELNNLEFDMAIILDKRSFINIYWSLLKREHILIFTFYTRKDYNLPFVKVARFIFLLTTEMALNVFFFSDETMHKMYLDYGEYNFFQQIPQIIYSTIVAQIMEVFLCFLSMTDKHYYEIKNLDAKLRYDTFKIIKCIKKKITFFFVITFVLFAFFWYAIACFCAVYVNTQSAFIKDSLTSFALGFLYPLILYLFPATFRFISLRATKSNLSWLYKISDIIPFF